MRDTKKKRTKYTRKKTYQQDRNNPNPHHNANEDTQFALAFRW